MSSWILFAVVAQFLFALSTLIDKHIVSRAAHIGKPIVYAFYVSLLSGFVLVLFPFISIPSLHVAGLSLLNASTFTIAIYFLYSALSHARASDVSPVVGGVSAMVTAVLAALLIKGDVTIDHVGPIVLLALGTAVISHFHFSRNALLFTLLAGFFFGSTIFIGKLIFLQVPFIEGFFWPRLFNVVVALALLANPSFRRAIFHGGTQSSRGAKSLVIGNKVLGGVAAALTAYAVSLGSVAVVNALAGLQFVFLYLFALLFAHRMPLFSESKTGSHGGWHTLLGITCIVLGLALLYRDSI